MQENSLLRWIRNRLKYYNLNCILAICGAVGSGKSYVSLRMAQVIDKKFSVARVCFSVPEVIKLLNSGTLRKGSAVVLEEGGVNVDSRQFFSQINRAIIHIAETFRSERLLFIINLPNLGGLDKRIRQLVHGYIEMSSIDRGKKLAKVRFLYFHTNPKTGKIYNFRIKVKSHTGRKLFRRFFLFEKPTKELLVEYEAKKKNFRHELQESIGGALELTEQRKKDQLPVDEKAIAEKILANQEKYISYRFNDPSRPYIDVHKIQTEEKVGTTRSSRIVRIVNDKLEKEGNALTA